jgi:hypothetical protein
VKGRAGGFRHLEFPLYHAGPAGSMVARQFADGRAASEELVFTEEEREFKRLLVEQFPTQLDFLGQLEVDRERFRDAPEYDFTKPPHAGQLLYERWGWDVTGERWRERAAAVLGEVRRSAFRDAG